MMQMDGEQNWNSPSEFKNCARDWAGKIGVRPSRIVLQRMTRKWASCSRSGIVAFNEELLTHYRQVGEAVIVHELIHLRVRNHGKLFRSLFRAFMPEGELLLAGALERLD